MATDLSSVIARLTELERIQAEITAEREELSIAKRVLERLDGNSASSSPVLVSGATAAFGSRIEEMKQNLRNRRSGRQTDIYIKVLKDSNSVWLTSNEIKAAASAIKGVNIPMSSVSPGLWELKNQGVIIRDGLKVALASRVETNKAPTSKPEEAS